MNDDSLKQLWQMSECSMTVTLNNEALLNSLNKKIIRFEKSIRKRDIREITAAFIVMIINIFYFIKMPFLMAKVGAAIIILSCIFISAKLVYAKNIRQPDTQNDIKSHLEYCLQRINNQIALLESVWLWYLFPFYVGVLVFYFAFPVSALNKTIFSVTVTVLYVIIYLINKRASKRVLKPLKKNIEEALLELNES
jgi:hypothetical protein